jgi:hypothetical protein
LSRDHEVRVARRLRDELTVGTDRGTLRSGDRISGERVERRDKTTTEAECGVRFADAVRLEGRRVAITAEPKLAPRIGDSWRATTPCLEHLRSLLLMAPRIREGRRVMSI